MDLDEYNRSFEEILESYDEEAEYKLQKIRQQCLKEFAERIQSRQSEWERTFVDLLRKSQEDNVIEKPKVLQSFTSLSTATNLPAPQIKPINLQSSLQPKPADKPSSPVPESKPKDVAQAEIAKPAIPKPDKQEQEFSDPSFSNLEAVKQFMTIQDTLEKCRTSFEELNTNPAYKDYKNSLNLYIRTQINSISNSDANHLNTKTRMLTNLFNGQKIQFQNKLVDASLHPQGQLFAMYLAAQTFVTVGSRLVNSVPAIAKSMATVINNIINNNLPVFRILILGHLQERCPYLIPMEPKKETFANDSQQEVKYKIACGYTVDSKTQSLESEEKYLIRMRSLVLIYASVLIQGQMRHSWAWLAAFLSLKPQPVISATVLHAFLQESSKKMSSTYGKQYNKLLSLIKSHYVKMIEEVSSNSADKQSLIRLKNLLSDDSNLIAKQPTALFGNFRFR